MMPLPSLSNNQSATSRAGFNKNGDSFFDFGAGDWNVNVGGGSQSKTALPSLPKSNNTLLLLLLGLGIVVWMKYR